MEIPEAAALTRKSEIRMGRRQEGVEGVGGAEVKGDQVFERNPDCRHRGRFHGLGRFPALVDPGGLSGAAPRTRLGLGGGVTLLRPRRSSSDRFAL